MHSAKSSVSCPGSASSCVNKAAKELGFSKLKPEQLEIATKFLEGRDVFGILPTGFGKSLCYGRLPLAFDMFHEEELGHSIIVVVSPLLSILKDQVSTFKSKGLSAISVSGETSDHTLSADVASGAYQLVFITPESILLSRRWRTVLGDEVYSARLRGLIIDEAHCVKKWGDSFRLVMRRLGEVRSLVSSKVNIMALTATATTYDRVSISRTLGLKNPFVLCRSPVQQNLIYAVCPFTTIDETFQKFCFKLKEERNTFPKTLIYGRSFSVCADIYIYFKTQLGEAFTYPQDAPDIPKFRLVDMFTSITEPNHKEDIIRNFKCGSSSLRVVIATIAFGMGIDCKDVQQVVHIGLPDDISSYIQETGRAGRGDLPAMVTLLTARTYHSVDQDIKEYARNDTICRRKALFSNTDNYKHTEVDPKCMCCDICSALCYCGHCDVRLKTFVRFCI